MKKVAFLLLVGVFAFAAGPRHGPKLAKDLEDQVNSDPASSTRVIIQWNNPHNDVTKQKVLSRGGLVHSTFQSIKGGVYTLTGSAIRDLESDPDVSFITPDRPVAAKL